MENARPNPDDLLKVIQARAVKGRGRLKIFFGACAGVGKTYAMLSAAREKHEDGVALLVGLVETHGRAETERPPRGLAPVPTILRQRMNDHAGRGLDARYVL